MSSSVLTGQGPVGEVEQAASTRRARGRSRRRSHGPISRLWVRTHRWASLTLGLLLLVQVTTGAVLLYQPEINELVHPDRYAATPNDHPMGLLDVLRMVQAGHPELQANSAQVLEGGAYQIEGPTEAAFVDPGTGATNAVGAPSLWILRLFFNIHHCGLTCEDYPFYQAWPATPIPWVSDDLTVGGAILGSLGVLLLLLVISGAVIWWPGIRAWVAAFVVRRGRGSYVRNLDLHRLVGIVALPFLFMWGFTGAAFQFTWPEQLYFALLPGSVHEDPKVEPGTGPQITFDDAIGQALALHPGAEITRLSEKTPTGSGGTYRIDLRDGFDPYRYSSFAGNTSVRVDSHGGGTLDRNPRSGDDAPVAQQLWDDKTYVGLHFGTIVPELPHIVWLAFGLSPILLAVTGTTIWLTKRRSRRNRARRRRTDARSTATA